MAVIKSLIREFREFAVKGSMVDLAIGIILGAAFSKVVTSLVSDVIMPPIGLVIGGVDFPQLGATLKAARTGPDGRTITPAVVLGYGQFINTLVDFLIVAFTVFLLVKAMNALRRRVEQSPLGLGLAKAPPPVPAQEKLLAEIRDLLKAQQKA